MNPQPKIGRVFRNDSTKEHELAALAVAQAEQQLRAGKASDRVLIHYLKVAATLTSLEREKLLREIDLLNAKVQSISSENSLGKLFEDARTAMYRYRGRFDEPT